MANKPQPNCPKCGAKMSPLFRKPMRGDSEKFVRAGTSFQCNEHEILAIRHGNGFKFDVEEKEASK